jgi:hypothetical protein
MKSIKYIDGLDVEKAKNAIEFLKTSKKPFQVIMTNYTINIKGSVNYKFMKEERSFKFFSMYNKLKKEVSNYLLKNEIAQCKNIYYYDITPKPDFTAKQVFNVDLTAAYLHVLKNEKIISTELFEELNALDKQDRLSIVGMLASKKSVYSFNESGEIINFEIIENKALRNVFFHCVNITFLIMQEIKNLIGESYIYSWVDGVYYTNEMDNFLIEDYLLKLQYPFKTETLENFIYKNDKEHVNIIFDKGIKTKTFNIPTKKNKFAADIYNYLQKQI